MSDKKQDPTEPMPARGSRTIQASIFKATCLDLMNEVEARHIELVITKHGRPVARVGPVDPTPPSPFGFLRNTVIEQGDVVGPEHDAWGESESDPLTTGES